MSTPEPHVTIYEPIPWSERLVPLYFYVVIIPATIFAVIYISLVTVLFTPGPPRFTVGGITFSTSDTIAAISVHNPHKLLGLTFGQKDSQISLSHNNVVVAEGIFPAFHLPPKSYKLLNVSLTGPGVSDLPQNVTLNPNLPADQTCMPLDLHTRVPMALKLGHLKILWTYMSIHRVPFKVNM